jgi:cyclic pyranopterin phosphate synthase
MSDRGLTHIDPLGRARMVDVTPKEATHRRAIARCKVFMKQETTSKVASNAMSKGDVLGAARIAGIQVAKRTSPARWLRRHQLHHRRRLRRGRGSG